MTVKYYDWVEYQSNFRPEKVALKENSKCNFNASRRREH